MQYKFEIMLGLLLIDVGLGCLFWVSEALELVTVVSCVLFLIGSSLVLTADKNKHLEALG